MRNIKALTLAMLVTLFGTSLALADYAMGVSGAIAKLEASGTETEGGEKTSADVTHTLPIASIFAEANDVMGTGITVGLDYIPVTADVSSSVKQRKDTETSVTGTATETTTARTQKAQAELSQHITLYAAYDIADGLFVKAGLVQVDLDTTESLDTGSKYGNETLNGYIIGVGIQSDVGSNSFARLEASYTDYEDVSITSSVARTGVSTNNKIEADLDVTQLKASFGYKF